MAFGIDEEPSGARSDVLGSNPGGRHAADFLSIEIVGVLMRPGHRVAVEIHALHELARFTKDSRDGSLHVGMGQEIQPGLAEAGETATVEALDIEYRVQHKP